MAHNAVRLAAGPSVAFLIGIVLLQAQEPGVPRLEERVEVEHSSSDRRLERRCAEFAGVLPVYAPGGGKVPDYEGSVAVTDGALRTAEQEQLTTPPSFADPPPQLSDAVSTPLPEYGLVFSPDGEEIYFARLDGPWGTRARSTLYTASRIDGGWTEPRPVFEESFHDGDPALSPDGRRLYFTTRRTVGGGEGTDEDIWMADRVAGEWTNLRPVPGINSPAVESSPVFTAGGRIYFGSTRPGGAGSGDIWVADPAGEEFSEPRLVGPPVSTPSGEWNVLVAPDERFLVVEASGRATNLTPRGDLYLHRRVDGGWTGPKRLEGINTPGSDLMPRLSPDGRHVFYTSSRTRYATDTDIHRIALDDFLSAASPDERDLLLVVSRSAHQVVALDPLRLEILAHYGTGTGPHELATVEGRDWIFTPDYGVYPEPHEEPIPPSEMRFTSAPSRTLTRLALDGLAGERTSFQVCSRSHGIAITPDEHVWVTCEEEGRVLELDGESGNRIEGWNLGVKGAHSLVATADGRHVIAANTGDGSVSIIDRQQATVTTVATAEGAEGLALAPDGRHLWVGNTQANSLSVVDLETKRRIDTFASEGRFPVKLAFAPDGSEAWVVNTFSRELTIFDPETRRKIGGLTFDSPPLGIGISPDGDHVYVTFPRLNEVRMFDRLARREVKRTDGVMEGDGIARLTVPR